MADAHSLYSKAPCQKPHRQPASALPLLPWHEVLPNHHYLLKNKTEPSFKKHVKILFKKSTVIKICINSPFLQTSLASLKCHASPIFLGCSTIRGRRCTAESPDRFRPDCSLMLDAPSRDSKRASRFPSARRLSTSSPGSRSVPEKAALAPPRKHCPSRAFSNL